MHTYVTISVIWKKQIKNWSLQFYFQLLELYSSYDDNVCVLNETYWMWKQINFSYLKLFLLWRQILNYVYFYIDSLHTKCYKNKYTFCSCDCKKEYISETYNHKFPCSEEFNKELKEFFLSKCDDNVICKLITGKDTISNESLHSITAKTTNKHTSTKSAEIYRAQVWLYVSENVAPKMQTYILRFAFKNSSNVELDNGPCHMISQKNCMTA